MIEYSEDQERAIEQIGEWKASWGDPMRQTITMGGFAGCLSGDSTILYNRGSRAGFRQTSLADLYLKYNGQHGSGRGASQKWRLDVATYLSSLFPDGMVRKNEVVAVFKSGEKKVIKVSFDDHSSLILTEDHPIAVGNDTYMAAGGLNLGTVVIGRGTLICKGGKGRRPTSQRPDRIIINTRFYPGGSVKIVECNGIFYTYKRVSRARLVYEANMNRLPYAVFLHALKHDQAMSNSFVYLDKNMDVHHIDENPLNDVIENLEAISHADHARHHKPEKHFNKDYTREVKVTNIQSAGREMTYDIQMQSPANNFCANGVFVHNTGKTTLISKLANEWEGVEVAALCGKAAHVLRKKGVEAQTIHRLIYAPIMDERGRRKFVLKGALPGVKVLIIDEASMVNCRLDEDLRSFDLPILYVGDHGQLEPIGDNPHLMANPEIRLEKIHRQASGNPILRYAAAVREGRPVPRQWRSKEGELTLDTREAFWNAVETEDDWQFICGYNKTRHDVNKMRRLRKDYKDVLEVGDNVICLKNNYDFMIFNGMQAVVRKIYSKRGSTIDMQIETDDGEIKELECLKRQFGRDIEKGHMNNEIALFDYGDCLTGHKSQGSEMPRVAVLQEIASMWDPRRWSYTAATRASETLLYCT